jgi:hypothetical protein
MLFGLRIKKLKWKIKMNEKTLKILLSKLNVHLNDLDVHNLHIYLIDIEFKNGEGVDGHIYNFEDAKKGELVFRSLNGM